MHTSLHSTEYQLHWCNRHSHCEFAFPQTWKAFPTSFSSVRRWIFDVYDVTVKDRMAFKITWKRTNIKIISLTQVIFFRVKTVLLLPFGPDEKNILYFLLNPCTQKQITQYVTKGEKQYCQILNYRRKTFLNALECRGSFNWDPLLDWTSDVRDS